MRLTDLDPWWASPTKDGGIRHHDSMKDAKGVCFKCPVCITNPNTNHHRIICWEPSVSQKHTPKPGRWTMHGTSFDDLSLRASSNSVNLTKGCKAHFFVENGNIRIV